MVSDVKRLIPKIFFHSPDGQIHYLVIPYCSNVIILSSKQEYFLFSPTSTAIFYNLTIQCFNLMFNVPEFLNTHNGEIFFLIGP